MTQSDPLAEANALREARIKEYSQYVATEPIFIGRARAFNRGDAVPASHVTSGVVDTSQVAKTNTKAADAATEKG